MSDIEPGLVIGHSDLRERFTYVLSELIDYAMGTGAARQTDFIKIEKKLKNVKEKRKKSTDFTGASRPMEERIKDKNNFFKSNEEEYVRVVKEYKKLEDKKYI